MPLVRGGVLVPFAFFSEINWAVSMGVMLVWFNTQLLTTWAPFTFVRLIPGYVKKTVKKSFKKIVNYCVCE